MCIYVGACAPVYVCVCSLPIPSFKILSKSCFPVAFPDGANLFPARASAYTSTNHWGSG